MQNIAEERTQIQYEELEALVYEQKRPVFRSFASHMLFVEDVVGVECAARLFSTLLPARPCEDGALCVRLSTILKDCRGLRVSCPRTNLPDK